MIFEEMMRDEREAGKLEGQMEAKQNTALNMHQKGYTDEAIAEVLEVDKVITNQVSNKSIHSRKL